MNAVSTQFSNFTKEINNGSMSSRLTMVVLGILVLYIVLRVTFYVIAYTYASKSPKLIIKGKLGTGETKTVVTDPNKKNSVEIVRSENGLQFAYSMWLKVKTIPDPSYNFFRKGSAGEAGPALYLSEVSDNDTMLSLGVEMDEYNKTLDAIVVDHIPIKKWFNLVVVVKQPHMYVYINGSLKDTYTTDFVFEQNVGDIYIDTNNTEIADLTYYANALNGFEIRNIVSNGVDTTTSQKVEDEVFPSYLHNSFYTS